MSGNPRQKRNASKPQDAPDAPAPHDTAGSAAAGKEDWVAIGEIAGPFGVHGELKIVSLSDFPDRFEDMPLVHVGDAHERFRVRSARQHKTQVLLTLEGVDSVEAAERLRGSVLYIPADELHALDEDQYYLHDVVGLRARHVNGTSLGIVTDIVPSSGNDLFVIRNEVTGTETLVPAVKAFIKEVDVAGGVIVVEPIPGLFDDEFEEAR